MKLLLRGLRALLIWIGPALILLLAVVCGFAAWCVGTQAGTRWALHVAMQQLDGRVAGVTGNLWDGLKVDALDLNVAGVDVSARQFVLQVAWRELMERRLHVRELSLGRLDVDVASDDEPPPESEPFAMPALPVDVVLDRLHLGELKLAFDGQPLPLDVQDMGAALRMEHGQAALMLQSLALAYEGMHVALEGELVSTELADPWPMTARISMQARSERADAPLCLRHMLPGLPRAATAGRPVAPAGDAAGAAAPQEPSALQAAPPDCGLTVQARAQGSLEAMTVALQGQGQDVQLDLDANLAPRAVFPLRDGELALRLADGSSLTGKADWHTGEPAADAAAQDRVTGWLRAQGLDLGWLAGAGLPPAMLSANMDFDVALRDRSVPTAAGLNLTLGEGAHWNHQPLAGTLRLRADHLAPPPVSPTGEQADAQAVPADTADTAGTTGTAGDDGTGGTGGTSGTAGQEPVFPWQAVQLRELDADLKLGQHRVRMQGSLGEPQSRLTLDIALSRLADVWPDLPGGFTLKGQLGGGVARHEARLQAVYSPGEPGGKGLGKEPVQVQLAVQGGWDAGTAGQPQGWHGRLAEFGVQHAGLTAKLGSALSLALVPQPQGLAWQAGATSLAVALPAYGGVTLQHRASSGQGDQWTTAGAIERLVVTRRLMRELQALLLAGQEQEDRGSVIVSGEDRLDATEIVLAADWSLRFAGALAGSVEVRRVSGDVIVPGERGFALGLQTLRARLTATPTGDAASRLNAEVVLDTERMGHASIVGQTVLRSPAGGGFVLADSDAKTVQVEADINDLSWTALFTGDAMEVGGSAQLRAQAASRPDGNWRTQGRLTGKGIRVVRVDDGVRLLDGELQARFEDDRFILERLRFPAVLRVKPQEWRTAEWISTNPDAKGGSLTISGSWNLMESIGAVDVDLYRYPILQRSDRYAMVSGKLRVDAPLPSFSLTGAVALDAGWADLDMLGSVPSLDGDVVVIRPGQKSAEAAQAMDMNLDLTVDLGPRFYITGYGVNSGLTGKLRITTQQGRLMGEGALRTRGGAIDIYGQHLQLRRGTLTFQGDITSPVLNIEALRTGVAVEAGVRVAGTAKRPRIDLVSYPEVSDVQKLSWLLLGRGPDDSGGDAALLFSVGTSFLGDGEPFYRKFGIDELSMKSGALGSAGSILPVESVVRGLDSGTSDIERKFVSASKNLGKGFTLSVEQALAETGTVGRASYQLARGLSAQLSAGTVNGIALIYRTLFRD